MCGSRDICFGYYTRLSHRARNDVLPGAVDSTQAATSLPDLRVGRRMACQSDIHELPWEGGGVTVERGNLPNSERCGGSRLMAGDNTYTIAPPWRVRQQPSCSPPHPN